MPPSILKKFSNINLFTKILFSILCGVSITAAMQPLNLFLIIWITIPFFIFILDTAQNRIQIFIISWSFGLGYFGSSFAWITNAFYVQAETYGWLAIPSILLLSAGFSFYISLIGFLLSFYPKGHAKKKTQWLLWHKIFFFASIWAIIEWFRGWFLTGFPWNPIGNIWSNYLYPAQIASIFGIYGLSLITILSSCSLYVFLNKGFYKSKSFLVIILNIPILLATSWGAHKITNSNISYVDNVELRLVQPNINQKEKWDKDLRKGHIDKILKMSLKENQKTTHIIWPEAAVTYPINKNNSLIKYISSSIPENEVSGPGKGFYALMKIHLNNFGKNLYYNII